jgi:hypothetical protein
MIVANLQLLANTGARVKLARSLNYGENECLIFPRFWPEFRMNSNR